jgi:hypothetical protein
MITCSWWIRRHPVPDCSQVELPYGPLADLGHSQSNRDRHAAGTLLSGLTIGVEVEASGQAGPSKMSRLLKVGLAGSGSVWLHLAAFASLPVSFRSWPSATLTRPAGTLAAQYDVPHVVTDMTDLCRMDDVDVIDVCTPSFLHYEQI